jgi:hypothetical protein
MGIKLLKTVIAYTNVINGLYNNILRLAPKHIFNILPPNCLKLIKI